MGRHGVGTQPLTWLRSTTALPKRLDVRRWTRVPSLRHFPALATILANTSTRPPTRPAAPEKAPVARRPAPDAYRRRSRLAACGAARAPRYTSRLAARRPRAQRPPRRAPETAAASECRPTKRSWPSPRLPAARSLRETCSPASHQDRCPQAEFGTPSLFLSTCIQSSSLPGRSRGSNSPPLAERHPARLLASSSSRICRDRQARVGVCRTRSIACAATRRQITWLRPYRDCSPASFRSSCGMER